MKLILKLIICVPGNVIFCDGVQVLLNGCVETCNCSLLQCAALACLLNLNDYRFRQKKTILDLQLILTPLLVESKSLPAAKLEDLYTSRYMSNLALLTIMRTWTGFFIFSGDLNGLNSYLNILSTHGEEEPDLAKQMLSVLFTVIGMPTPSLLKESTKTHPNNIYWNDCSLFLSDISQSSKCVRRQTNLLTTYLSFITWSLLNSKLPEILSNLMVVGTPEVAFLAKALLQNLVYISSVFVCMSDMTTSRTVQEAVLSFQTVDTESEEELRRKARARSCFMDIGSTSTFLYPILESQTFVPSSLTETFANFSLFYSILDCYCNNPNPSKDLDLIGWICNQGVPFQSFISKSYEAVIENRSFFLSLLRAVRVRFPALFHG